MRLYRHVTNHCDGRKTVAILLISLFSSGAFATSNEYSLGNGLKLVVKEDHRSPVVISQIWYKAGSIDELNGVTGVAHGWEHIMMQGKNRLPGGHVTRRAAAAGGRENPLTSRDYTA